MSKKIKALIVGLLLLAAFVVAGTGDLQDEIVQEKVTADILASAPQWAVTSR